MAETTTTTWYLLSKFSTLRGSIVPVEVLKESEHQLVIKARYGLNPTQRVSKKGTYDWYFKTWQEAKDFFVAQAQDELERVQRQLENATTRLKEAQELQP